MSSLPQEVIVEILSWLPVKSLLRFRSVSKTWRTLISNPHFITSHLNHSIQTEKLSIFFKSGPDFFDLHSPISFHSPNLALPLQFPFHNPTEIIGSCNGLICISTHSKTIFLINPSTRSHTQLPITPVYNSGFHFNVFGFGYSPITHEYKILYIVYFQVVGSPNSYHSEVTIHTLGTPSWRRIADIPGDIRDRASGTLVNGYLNWIATRVNPINEMQEMAFTYVIVSFDIGNEEFGDIPLPQFDTSNYNMTALGELRGCLCMFRNFYEEQVEIWVMKEYGVKDSWTQQFNIREPTIFGGTPKYFNPFRLLQNWVFLLRRSNGRLVLYDPRNGSSRDIVLRGVPSFFILVLYVESLVLLKYEEPLRL